MIKKCIQHSCVTSVQDHPLKQVGALAKRPSLRLGVIAACDVGGVVLAILPGSLTLFVVCRGTADMHGSNLELQGACVCVYVRACACAVRDIFVLPQRHSPSLG